MRRYLTTAAVSMVTIAFALGFFFAGFFVHDWVGEKQGPTPTPTLGSLVVGNVSADDDPAVGPEDAPVTIIQFSDFQCPFSKRYFDETEQLILSAYGDQVSYVFRDYPLVAIHPQAQKAAEAAQCSFDQGKYWEYHDMLFQNQGALDVDSLKSYATALGLDETAFNLCIDSGKYAEEVEKDIEDGRSYGVTGSPTFFINGRKVVGALPYDTFQIVIEEELPKTTAGQ